MRLIIALIWIMRRTSASQNGSDLGGGDSDSAKTLTETPRAPKSGHSTGQRINQMPLNNPRMQQLASITYSKSPEAAAAPTYLSAHVRRRREYRVVLLTLIVLVTVYMLCFAPRFATRVIWELAGFEVEIDMQVVLLLSRVGDFGQPFYALVSFLVHVAANRRYRRLFGSFLPTLQRFRREDNIPEGRQPGNTRKVVRPGRLDHYLCHFQEVGLRPPNADRIDDENFAARTNVYRMSNSRNRRTFLGCVPTLFQVFHDFCRKCLCCCFRRKCDPLATHWANDPTQPDLQYLEQALRGGYHVRGYPMNESLAMELLPPNNAAGGSCLANAAPNNKNIRDPKLDLCDWVHRMKSQSDNVNRSLGSLGLSPLFSHQSHLGINTPNINDKWQMVMRKDSFNRCQLNAGEAAANPKSPAPPRSAYSADEAHGSPCTRLLSEFHEHSRLYVWKSRDRTIFQLQQTDQSNGGALASTTGITHSLSSQAAISALASQATPFARDVPTIRSASSIPNFQESPIVYTCGNVCAKGPDGEALPVSAVPFLESSVACCSNVCSEPVPVNVNVQR